MADVFTVLSTDHEEVKQIGVTGQRRVRRTVAAVVGSSAAQGR